MSDNKIPNIDYTRLITCVLYEGGSVEILEMLREKGVNEACFYSVRGAPIGRSSEVDGLPEIPKTEILNAIVAADQADYIYEAIYDMAGVDETQKGNINVKKILRATENNLPSDDEELKAA